jgi:glycosyltransferase involved in cell wall biosynthesis
MPRALWITWENQRRSVELARALDVPLHVISGTRYRWLRYPICSLKTAWLLVKSRPSLLFVQNPSIVLAALACLLSRPLRVRVIVDRHSNFDFANLDRGLGNRLSDYSLRSATLTIVTNDELARLVESKGGRAFVLPDRLPTLRPGPPYPFAGTKNVVFVCTYKADEPLDEVLAAARLLPPGTTLYVTGDHSRLPASKRTAVPSNVVLTGFLPSPDYDRLLSSANVVLELTLRDHTLLCGAYEAVSAGTPLVLSNKAALTSYFNRGAIVTENDADSIAASVVAALDAEERLWEAIRELRDELARDWDTRFAALGALLHAR